MKRCNQCGVEKPLDAFHKKDNGRRRRQPCAECRRRVEPYEVENPSRWHKGVVRKWLATLGLRPCWQCHSVKPLDSFPKGSGTGGLNNLCKSCAVCDTTRWRDENPAAYRAQGVQKNERKKAGHYGMCSIEGCSRYAQSHGGLCGTHLSRRTKHGDDADMRPDTLRLPNGLRGEGALAWYEDHGYLVRGDDGECWEWLAGPKNTGYGKVGYRGAPDAHRFVYETLTGEDITGLHLHHECLNRLCVNPEHLVPMSAEDHLALHRANSVMELVEAV